MSILMVDAVVLTLKRTVSPLLTLMSVAKPWSVLSPDPVISHSDLGEPVWAFSQIVGFGQHWAKSRARPFWLSTAVIAARRASPALIPIVRARRRRIVIAS